MAPRESFGKVPSEGVQDRKGDGKKIEWKSSEVNTRAVSRGQNELTGKFKMVTRDVIMKTDRQENALISNSKEAPQ